MTRECMSLRARQTRILVRPLLRAVQWRPIVAAAGVGAGIVALMRAGDAYEPGSALRFAAVTVCLGAAFLLDDGASALTAASPSPLMFRRSLRVAFGAVVGATVWGALILYATAGDARDVPLARLSLELTAFAALTLAVAAGVIRYSSEGRGGLAAGPTLLAILAVAVRLPKRWSVFVAPAHPRWDEAGAALLVVLGLSCAALAFLSFDPARRRIVKGLLEGRTAAARGETFGSAGGEEV